MGRGRASYARERYSSGTKRWRGTSRIAWRTRGSEIPSRWIWSLTIASRAPIRGSCCSADRPTPVDSARTRTTPGRHRRIISRLLLLLLLRPLPSLPLLLPPHGLPQLRQPLLDEPVQGSLRVFPVRAGFPRRDSHQDLDPLFHALDGVDREFPIPDGLDDLILQHEVPDVSPGDED